MHWLVISMTAMVVAPQTIYHQYEADHEEFPYIVSIQGRRLYRQQDSQPYRLCSGSLVSQTWVLTAAHCLLIQAFRIRYGDLSLPGNMSQYSNILKMVRHPGYHMVAVTHTLKSHTIHAINDIGMLHVQKVTLRGIAKLSSIDYKSLFGELVTYAGYGDKPKRKVDQRQGPEHLQSSDGAVGPCDAEYQSQTLGLCVVQKCGVTYENKYPGEMGGPLLHDGKIVGVCIDTALPSSVGFAPISPYLEWLCDVVNGTVL